MRSLTSLTVVGAVLSACPSLFAQSTLLESDWDHTARHDSLRVPPPTANEVTAVFLENAPRIDGHLDDAAWAGIPPVTRFIQVWPEDGSPATEQTEVRVGYDRDNLYFAFKFHDKHPDLIRAKNMERGGRNDRDDNAYIGLDTFQDGRNAYLFEMNALGTQDDATITDETLTIDSFSWDAVWRSETVIDDEGWSMEVSIPFRQLRFPKGDNMDFGLMLSRTVNRKNERSLWPPIGLEYAGSSFNALAIVSQYGTLKGLKNVARGKNLEIKPYVITGVQESRSDLGQAETTTDVTQDVGGDLKYGINSSLTLDLTVNTDFAQVEADNVQLNLTRFSLFFPEKREFFLERSGLFEHGNSQTTQTFFSRRIGLEQQILAGARLTGQVGRVSVGLMNIEEGDKMSDILGAGSTNNTVARIRTDILPRATIGSIFTNLEQAGHYNRAAGVDAKYRFAGSSELSGWYTKVWDSDPLFDDAAGHVLARLENDVYGAQATFTSVGEHYNPALGFVRRRDMREFTGQLIYRPFVTVPSLSFVRRLYLQGDYDYIEGQNGAKQSTDLTVRARTEFSARDYVELAFERQFESLEEPFFIRPDAEIATADYAFSGLTLTANSDQSRRTFAYASLGRGNFFDGTRTDIGGGAGIRQSRHLTVEGDIDHSIIDLPIQNGEFAATRMSLSTLGAVSRKLFAKALVQYDNFTRDVQANIRVDWIHTPGSDLFFVFNTSYHVTSDNDELFDPRKDVVLNNQAGVLKLTYLVLL